MATLNHQNLQSLLSKLEQELQRHENTINCPHCGGSLMVISGTAAAGRRSVRGTSRKSANGKVAVSARPKSSPGRKRRSRRPSKLVSLALQYAKAKHNGRIGDAYRDVKEGISMEAKGKRPDEVKALKADWFRQQLSR